MPGSQAPTHITLNNASLQPDVKSDSFLFAQTAQAHSAVRALRNCTALARSAAPACASQRRQALWRLPHLFAAQVLRGTTQRAGLSHAQTS